MVAFVFLAVVFLVLAIAGIAGWSADSRDSRFSLWPLNRVAPNDPPQPDTRPRAVPQPTPQSRHRPRDSVVPPGHHGNAHGQVTPNPSLAEDAPFSMPPYPTWRPVGT
jgi:hypothetical protein